MKPPDPQFTCHHCGRCCGPIPIVATEWAAIIEAVDQLPWPEVMRLKKQKREPITCPLRDIEKQRCAIYDARPLLCRMYGYFDGLVCPNNPTATVWAREAGYDVIKREHAGQEPIGALGETITWREILRALKLIRKAREKAEKAEAANA